MIGYLLANVTSHATDMKPSFTKIFLVTIWLFNIAMERSTMPLIGEPSISIRAITKIFLRFLSQRPELFN